MGNLQRVSRGLEHRLAMTQTELAATKSNLAACQSDYDSYKVRTAWGSVSQLLVWGCNSITMVMEVDTYTLDSHGYGCLRSQFRYLEL